MSVQTIAPASAGEPAKKHLGWGHPLFEVAARHCDRHGRTVNALPCGACWELAIRDDERVVIEYGLPREIAADLSYVDEVAVALACRGERVKLTVAERAEAVNRLAAKGLTRGTIATLLHIAARDIDPSVPRSTRARSGRSLALLHKRRAVTR